MVEMLHKVWGTLSSSPVLGWVMVFLVIEFIGTRIAFFRARKCQPGAFRWPQAAKEAVLITISGALGIFFLGALTHWLGDHGWTKPDPTPVSWWVAVLEFGVFAVLFDTWFYWWHRFMHIEPIYTLIHRWHHTSLTPTIVSTVNVNPLESLINGGFIPMFFAGAYLLGTPIHSASAPWIGGSAALVGFWIHSGFEMAPRWWNKTWATKWLITTTFHDQHHQYFRYNYSGFFTIWDRICGTMRSKYEQDLANPRSRMLEEKRKAAKRAAKEGGNGAPEIASVPELEPA